MFLMWYVVLIFCNDKNTTLSQPLQENQKRTEKLHQINTLQWTILAYHEHLQTETVRFDVVIDKFVVSPTPAETTNLF